MKALLALSLFISSTVSAQSLTLDALKKMMTEKKETIEKLNPGMRKSLTTKSKIEFEEGVCEFILVSEQTVVKIENLKMIVLAQESFKPSASEVCESAGYVAYEDSILFYEDVPTLEQDLADLDSSSNSVKNITRAGTLVTMNLETEGESVQFKFDLSKPSFKNLVLLKGEDFETKGQDLSDLDLSTLDLSDVFFCEKKDEEFENCIQGDFSDVLF
jgi:hypothetical protein